MPRKRLLPYWLSLAIWVLALGGLTTAFVLVVLPQRYVFQTGLRASGVSFPAEGAPFGSADVVMVAPSPRAEPEPAEPVEEPAPPPGPAETLWARVGPLLEEGREAEAIPLLEAYLADHPDDIPVRMEYGIALVRAGELEKADEAFRRVIAATDDRRASLERAHLLRDRGEWDAAAELYGELSRERPDEQVLRLEHARALARAERWDEAERAYVDVLAAAPERHDLRLELAEVLWTADRPDDAERVAASVPQGAPERTAAVELRERIAILDEPVDDAPDPEEIDRLDRALAAIEEQDVERVLALYRDDRAEREDAPDRLLAWADIFQYRLEDMARARTLLEERAELVDPTPALRLRLAHLYTWSGREEEAVAELELALAEDAARTESAAETEDATRAEVWALLGDVRRWWDERPLSADAYDRALVIDDDQPRAIVGRQALAEATARAITDEEGPGIGPTLDFFRDSEGFRRMDLTAHAALVRDRRDVVRVRSGFRRLEGSGIDGAPGLEDGLFAEVELARWWREGTVRASVTVGAERMDPSSGVRPVVGADVRADGFEGWDLTGSYRREQAYAVVTTFESLDLVIHADRLRVAVERALGSGWSLAAGTEAGSLRGGGETTWRGGADLGLHHRLAPVLRVGATSHLLGYSGAAPVPLDRPAFWDPELFWATELPIELQTDRTRGWNAHARVSPGVGLVRSRDAEETSWIPQVGGEVGARYRGDRASFDANLFHTRGREGDYDALGFSVHLSIRR